MELQDAPATYLFKVWPAIEANKNRILWGGGVILVAAGLILFISMQRSQRESTAAEGLTRLMLTVPRNTPADQQADLYLKFAAENQGTTAAQRALLQGATEFLAAGKFAGAQEQFQKFLDVYPGNYFSAQAALGVAASLEGQDKLDLAAAAYQRILNSYTDVPALNHAKYALAQIDERQGKWNDALSLYEEVARSNPNGMLGSEAGGHALELRMKLPSPAPAAASAPAFTPNP